MNRHLCFLLSCILILLLIGCNDSTSRQQKSSTESTSPGSVEKISEVAETSTIKNQHKTSPRNKKRRKNRRILQCALNNSRFDPQKWLRTDRSFPPPGPPGRISHFDPVIKKMARRYGFDWRLIAAQIYAESRFDTSAQSHAGARGLMQIMPKTATYLGTNPVKLIIPEVNIATGCLYDRRMVTLWKRNVKNNEERLAFALASYNAGRGRVLRSFSTADSLTEWQSVHPLLPIETQDYVHRIALKYDFYSRHALP